jgi:predicted ester cyclase
VNSDQHNKDVVLRFVEIVNTGAVWDLAAIISPECVETDGIVRVNSGVAGMVEHINAVRHIYPDLHLTVDRQIAEGEWVATQYAARGTHSREWLGMTPSGKPLVFTGVNVDRVVNGLIVEHGGAANMLVPFLQAGSLRPTRPSES